MPASPGHRMSNKKRASNAFPPQSNPSLECLGKAHFSSAMTGGLLRGVFFHPLVEITHIFKKNKINKNKSLLEEASLSSRHPRLNYPESLMCAQSWPPWPARSRLARWDRPRRLRPPEPGAATSPGSVLLAAPLPFSDTHGAGTADQALLEKLSPTGRGHARHAVTIRGLPREAPHRLRPPLWAADPAAIFLPRRPRASALGPQPAAARPRRPARPRSRELHSVSDG